MIEIPQALINWALGVAAALMGWWGRQIWDSQKELARTIAALELKIAENYAPNAHLQNLKDEIFVVLRRIEDKLEKRLDRLDR